LRSCPRGLTASTAVVRDSGGSLRVWDEESGELHRELEGFAPHRVLFLASFLSADGQQSRLVAGSLEGHLRVYDPEAGLTLHRLKGHTDSVIALACIASSSAAPQHPRLVSTSWDCTAKVWDGETGEWLADLPGHTGALASVAVWKEHTGGHDRIATAYRNVTKVWDGEAFTLLHNLIGPGDTLTRSLPFKSAEGPTKLLVTTHNAREIRVYDPEEGRLLHAGINRDCPFSTWHLFESAQGRHLLAILGMGIGHPRHPGGARRPFLDVWDLGEAPAATGHIRPAHKHG
jgi:WD40 repeat protein